MRKDWFEEWFDTDYYQMLYLQRNELEANDFASQLDQHLKLGTGARILDVGCGRGRYALAFHRMGHQVTGIDLSAVKTRLNQSLQSEGLEFFQHDMRRIFRVNYFDLVVNLFTSFGYFETQHDERSAARSIATNARWNGYVVLDFLNAETLRKRLVPRENIHRADVQFQIHRYATDRLIIKEIVVEDGEFTKTYLEKVRLYSMQELIELFSPFHLQWMGSYGDYQLNPYIASESDRMILVFQKKVAHGVAD